MQEHWDEQEAIVARARALVLELCREVDPEVKVTLSAYRWHGDLVLDILLQLPGKHGTGGGHDHHLEVTAERLEIVERDHEILKHDIEEAVHDLHRHHPAATNEAGHDVHRHAAGAATAGAQLDPYEALRPKSLRRRGAPRPAEPGAVHEPSEEFPPALVTSEPPPAPVESRVAAPEMAGAPETAPDAGPVGGHPTTHRSEAAASEARAIERRDRETLDRLMELTRHIVAELDPEAEVTFEEYLWHGELVLDILVSLHGNDHHLEVTASRASILLRDHEILHHDLEGMIGDIHREAGVRTAGAAPIRSAEEPAGQVRAH